MDMATALTELGVTEAGIDAQTRERLDRDGYVPLPGVLSAAQLTAIRTRLAELLDAEGDQAGLEVHQENGADRLADLVNKGAMFDPCFTDPRVLAYVAHVLGDFKLSSLNPGGTRFPQVPPACTRGAGRPGRAASGRGPADRPGRRANGQQLDQKKYARPQILSHLSPAARFILDV